MNPEKLLPLIPHSHQPAKAGILLLQQRVQFSQDRALRPYRFTVFQPGRVVGPEPIAHFLSSLDGGFDAFLAEAKFVFDCFKGRIIKG
jgi:hypothetical protein